MNRTRGLHRSLHWQLGSSHAVCTSTRRGIPSIAGKNISQVSASRQASLLRCRWKNRAGNFILNSWSLTKLAEQ